MAEVVRHEIENWNITIDLYKDWVLRPALPAAGKPHFNFPGVS